MCRRLHLCEHYISVASLSRTVSIILSSRWRQLWIRRRLVLGFYAILLVGVLVAVVVLVGTVVWSRSPNLSDRLAETSDWLAGGTLVLAAIAGLVALEAYPSATGRPDLKLALIIEGPQLPRDDSDPERPICTRRVDGPFRFLIAIRNDSDYSAGNPAVVMRLPGNYLATHSSQIGEGWTITDGTKTRYSPCNEMGGVDAHVIPQACAHVIPQGPGWCLFYLMSSFPVGTTRPGRLLGR
jgi:hypothetical protein